MAEPLDLSVHTVFAELIQRTLDADFEAQFPGPGSIVFRTVKDHRYAYWQPSKPAPDGTRVNHYIGPMVDPDVAARVDRFGSLKDAEKQRRSLVQMLKAASLPSPSAALTTGVVMRRTSRNTSAAVTPMKTQPFTALASTMVAGSLTTWPSSQSEPRIQAEPNSA